MPEAQTRGQHVHGLLRCADCDYTFRYDRDTCDELIEEHERETGHTQFKLWMREEEEVHHEQ